MFDVICVTNRTLCQDDFWKRLEAIARTSVKSIILREKDLTQEEYLKFAQIALKICSEQKKELILHSYSNVAKKLSKAKIHLPLPLLEKNPEIAKDFEMVGTSVHSLEQLKKAEKLGASYVIAGHIFTTDCKKDLMPRGIEFLQSICDNSTVPVYGIGGINEKTIPLLKNIKSDKFAGACIMNGFMTCENPKEFLKKIKGLF